MQDDQLSCALAEYRKDPVKAAVYNAYNPKRFVGIEKYWDPEAFIYPVIQALDEKDSWLQYPLQSTGTTFLSMTLAVKYGVPTYFVTKELATMLLKTKPPVQLPLSRIQLPYPALRVVFEKGTLPTVSGEYMGFTIAKANGTQIDTPEAVKHAVDSFPPFFKFKHGFLVISGLLNEEDAFRIDNYATQFEDETIKLGELNGLELLKDVIMDDMLTKDENDSLRNLNVLALNLMMYLMARPEDIKENQLIRRGRQKGKRRTDDLWSPRTVGVGYKIRYIRADGTPHTNNGGTPMVSGWRAGHWKEQAYGPKYSLRREQLIDAYGIGEFKGM